MNSSKRKKRRFRRRFYAGMAAVVLFFPALNAGWAGEKQGLGPGEYLFRASGGCSCHTDFQNKGRPLAGGRALKTPYGDVFSTNITPDNASGIGNWNVEDFIRAMRLGMGPDKKRFFILRKHYFPVFPYTAFTRIREPDLTALWRFLKTVPPAAAINKKDKMVPPFNWRFNMIFWKWFNFRPGEYPDDPDKSAQWNRGAYLSRALAHCEECHSPRNFMGGLKTGTLFTGSKDGPEGRPAPNITPDEKTGIGSWDSSDLAWFLKSGQKPNGDFAEGLMSEVIVEGYQYLTDADLDAVALYIMSLDPVERMVE